MVFRLVAAADVALAIRLRGPRQQEVMGRAAGAIVAVTGGTSDDRRVPIARRALREYGSEINVW